MSDLFTAHKARFDRLCADAMRRDIRLCDSGIGTLGEKRLHAVIKRYLCEDEDCHEVGVLDTRFVSDVRIGSDVYEVQTGGFYPMKKKIAHYLEKTDCTVTIVHPLPAVRWMAWIDPKTAEISPRRKVSAIARPQDLLPELYALSYYLQHPRLKFRLLLLETQDFRVLNPRARSPKSHTKHYERIPLSLIDEIDFDTPDDFRRLIPSDLPTHFTVKDFSAHTKIRGINAYSAVRALVALGIVQPADPIGRAMGFRVV